MNVRSVENGSRLANRTFVISSGMSCRLTTTSKPANCPRSPHAIHTLQIVSRRHDGGTRFRWDDAAHSSCGQRQSSVFQFCFTSPWPSWHFAALTWSGRSVSPLPRSVVATCCWSCATHSRRFAICWSPTAHWFWRVDRCNIANPNSATLTVSNNAPYAAAVDYLDRLVASGATKSHSTN